MSLGCISLIPKGKTLNDGFYEIDNVRLFLSPKGKLMIFISDDWYDYFQNKGPLPHQILDVDDHELFRVLRGG